MAHEADVPFMAFDCTMTMRSVETHIWRSGPHHSARYLILFFSEADAMLTLGERMLSLVNGCIVLIPPETAYTFAYGSRCRYFCLSFEPANGEKSGLLRQMYEKRSNIIHLEEGRLRESLQYQAEQLYGMLHHGAEELVEYRQGYVAACFTKLIFDVFSLQEQMKHKIVQDTRQMLAMQLTAYLDANYLSAITLEQLGKVFFLSRYHLCRLFRAQMEMSIVDYIHWKRVQHAIGLLSDTDLDVTKICYESGFGNLQSFYSIFKRYVHKTPLQYRKGKPGEKSLPA